ncbi:hypothetical protein VSX64_22820 [Aurantimonas sp. C2-6-R+9]|uniref:hypothetical protein n=1 Tax=unclassified Aurantimonas TaxID=2638230 RepID=UPI002E193630|nr:MULTISPECIES: hypothetical protein [unclassified Aurantimonas]MEC5293586.1 hypothetical protein [Aurantimonas sp. C2-3-R2]MEC5383602.1 hypothetical protein [Aurantimonas sp. C2-6-R+9]MEC5414653.1 hypothetical protein [Aurantimonas sp. C2-4-R8]
MAKQKRDNVYYEARLKREHPATYADLKAGRYRSLGEAVIAAGIRKPRPRVRELQNAWKKASESERAEFIQWLKVNYGKKVAPGRPPAPSSLVVSPSPSATIPAAVTTDRRLEPWARTRMQQILDLESKSVCDAAYEIGSPTKLNAALRGAIDAGNQIKSLDPNKISEWLERGRVRHGLV